LRRRLTAPAQRDVCEVHARVGDPHQHLIRGGRWPRSFCDFEHLGTAVARHPDRPHDTLLSGAARPGWITSTTLDKITIVPAFAARRLSAEGDLAVVRWSRCINVQWVVATRKETPEPPLASFLDLLGKAHPGASAASGGRKRPRSTPSASMVRGDHSQI